MYENDTSMMKRGKHFIISSPQKEQQNICNNLSPKSTAFQSGRIYNFHMYNV